MTPRHVSVMVIVERAASLYGCTADDIFSLGRSRTIAEARKVAMYAARERLGWSYPELGRAFMRDNTTVMNAVSSIDLQRRCVERIANAVRVLCLTEAEAAE